MSKPKYALGLMSEDFVSPHVLNAVEDQLIKDLEYYGIRSKEYYFDWSEATQEGHVVHVLDSRLESQSNVSVYSKKDRLIAKGWIDFVHDEKTGFARLYWEGATIFVGDKSTKIPFGIPDHIFENNPNFVASSLREKYGK